MFLKSFLVMKDGVLMIIHIYAKVSVSKKGWNNTLLTN
ncbi:hypothetical protein SPONN_271 [uncultured Candidatus Thioglobus sp.]|nr:hypothetical protein SPONN_271 [uncultured Candidatus Thioglobus sp.]